MPTFNTAGPNGPSTPSTNRVNRWTTRYSVAMLSFTDRDISGGASARELARRIFGLSNTVAVGDPFSIG